MSATLAKNHSYRHAPTPPIAITSFIPAAYSQELRSSHTRISSPSPVLSQKPRWAATRRSR